MEANNSPHPDLVPNNNNWSHQNCSKIAPLLNPREEEPVAKHTTGRRGGEVKAMVTEEMAKGGGRKAEKEKCYTCTF